VAEVRDIVGDALRELGVLGAGEVLSADEATNGLTVLNRMVDGLAAERLAIYQVVRTLWTIVSGTQDYTVGTGGAVAVARPVYIDHVNLVDTGTDPDLETPLGSFTDDAWAGLAQKALTAARPSATYYNPTFPLGTLSLWPVPTDSSLQGALYAPQAVAEFASLDTVISLPPGYRRMLVTNLAVELAPSFERPASQDLLKHAAESKGVVKRANKRLSDLSIDPGALGQAAGRRRGAWDINRGP
jgi:hypothetical protein